MGKSSHNLRKRKSSSSTDRLAALEEKMTRLIEALSRAWKSASRSPSSYKSALSMSCIYRALSRGPISRDGNIFHPKAVHLRPLRRGPWQRLRERKGQNIRIPQVRTHLHLWNAGQKSTQSFRLIGIPPCFSELGNSKEVIPTILPSIARNNSRYSRCFGIR